MFFKQLDNIIRNVAAASRIIEEERRCGEERRSGIERRKSNDRRSEPRFGDSMDRRLNPDRRQQVTRQTDRLWYESLGKSQ